MQKTWNQTNDSVVVSTALEKVEREIALMKRLRHPNLVQLIDVVDDEEQDQYFFLSHINLRIYMVIEYVENGQVMYYDPSTHTFSNRNTRIFVSLLSLVDGVLTEAMAKKYLYDIVSGLQYRCVDQITSSLVHIHKVVHRDIKPENILISKDDHCKISNSISFDGL